MAAVAAMPEFLGYPDLHTDQICSNEMLNKAYHPGDTQRHVHDSIYLLARKSEDASNTSGRYIPRPKTCQLSTIPDVQLK